MTHSIIEKELAVEYRRSGGFPSPSRDEAIAADTPAWEI
jgi:hypothetical protein